MATAGPALHVVWFKRDLRVADHAPLAEAAAVGLVLPLYVVEPGFWAEPDASGRQWTFAAECLAELDAALGRLGQRLVVRVGDVIEVLDDIARRPGIAAIWSHEETGNAWTYARDQRVAAWARARAIPWHERPQTGVHRRLKSRDGWAAAWDRRMAQPTVAAPRALKPLAGVARARLPSARDLGLADDRCPGRQTGGRKAGAKALESFLKLRGRHYRREMSSPLTGETSCSRLSPHLAWGTLSMREVAQATWAEMRELKARPPSREVADWRGSLVSFSGRLHWHCHFMQKLEDEPALEHRELHPRMRGARGPESDTARLQAWARGETGFPFLDACMRSLAATGWLNFRMRAMVMSFASYNLWLHWRDSGLVLARLFTDYEPGIHWPQAQMQSGTTGINTIRIYNVVKQGYDQDPEGAFVRRWVPELTALPTSVIHEPWRSSEARQLIRGRYPEPIVDLERSAREAKERIFALRRGPGFAAAADAVQERHGSRKSGIPMTGRRPGRRRVARPDQLDLDL